MPQPVYHGRGDRRWLQADERGSVVAVSDASGNAIAINRYDEYGIPQSGNVGRYQYTGQTWFPEVGLYNYKARWYSPTMGRFMQTDPIGYADGLNWYDYVGGDPVNNVDPTGLACQVGSHSVPNGSSWATFNDANNNGKLDQGERINGTGVCAGSYSGYGNLGGMARGGGIGGGGSSGGGGSGGSPESGESKPCAILAAAADKSKSALPSYLTDNKNWNDLGTLQGYRNLYQSSLNEYTVMSGRAVTVSIAAAGWLFSLTPWGKGAKAGAAATAAAAGEGISVSELKDSTQAAVSAIDARMNQLRAGC